MIRILVFGAGRMAHSLLSVAGEFPEVEIQGLVYHDPAELPDGNSTVPMFDSLDGARASLGDATDLVIDFSLAAGTPQVARWCGQNGMALLSGVTGIDADTHAALDKAGMTAPVFWAPNLSFGVNLLAGILREIAPVIGRAGISIEETHHAGKIDAPSGTALFLAGQLEPEGEVEFHSIREGDVVGEHSVEIRLADETLTLSHTAHDRRLFARGALEAAVWLAGQNPGRYSAADWISGVIEARTRGSNGQA